MGSDRVAPAALANKTSQGPTQFDLVHSPLHGRVLLEASAGTGKTFSVTKIAIRFLLAQGIPIEKLLLVTFTNLATAELKSALTEDLRHLYQLIQSIEQHAERAIDYQAIDAYQQHSELSAEGEILLAFLAQLTDEQLAQAPGRVSLALKSIDLVPVATLHEFANRQVRELGFELAAAHHQIFTINTQRCIEQALHDFIREHQALIHRVPDLLSLKKLKVLLHQSRNVPNAIIPSDIAIDTNARFDDQYASLEHHYQNAAQEMINALDNLVMCLPQGWSETQDVVDSLTQQGAFNNKKIAQFQNNIAVLNTLVHEEATAEQWFHKINQYSVSDNELITKHPLFVLSAHSFAKTFLVKKYHNEVTPTQLMHVVEALIEPYRQWLVEASRYQQAMYAYAKRWLKHRYDWLLEREDLADVSSSFEILANALRDPAQGERVAAEIRARYPLAIVDEFQDTDPLQFEILDAVYSDTSSHHLILVGDPKQSIYRFRGADIYAYLSVIKSLNYYYYLDTNFRSDRGIVDAVNVLFAEVADHTRPSSFRVPNLSFHPVKAHHQTPRLMLDGAPAEPAMEVVLAESNDVSKESNWNDLLLARINHYMTSGQIQEGVHQRAVDLSDMAVLVFSNSEGENIYQYLGNQGIPCILYGTQTVWETLTARMLSELLQVIVKPIRSDQVSFILLSGLFGYDAERLLAAKANAEEWITILNAFEQANRAWYQSGISAALNGLDQAFGIRDHLIRSGRVRDLADYEHLAELLHQQASQEQAGPQTLMAWYNEVLASPLTNDDSDNAQRRLDRDAQAITIITVHKSKGLEYPIVFIPRLYSRRTPRGSNSLSVIHQSPDAYRSDMVASQANNTVDRPIIVVNDQADHLDDKAKTHIKEQRLKERVAENLRLFYVALTRASMRVIVFESWWSLPDNNPPNREYDPLYALLRRHSEQQPDKIVVNHQLISDLAQQNPDLFSVHTESFSTSFDVPEYAQWPIHTERYEDKLQIYEFTRTLRPAWTMTSFSALMAQSHASADNQEAYDLGLLSTLQADKLLEAAATPHSPSSTPAFASEIINNDPIAIEQVPKTLPYRYRFPAGPQYGTLIHDIYEQVSFADLARESDQAYDQILAIIANASLGVSIDARELLQWLGATCRRPIRLFDHLDCRLADCDEQSIAEVEFNFPVSAKGLASFSKIAQALDDWFPGVAAWLGAHPLALQQYTDKGYLKGFIDLTLRVNNQYLILDYKSNHLGEDDHAYSPEHLSAKMVDSGYWLQLVIYTIALHRWLAQQKHDYDYDRDIGGGIFYFVRGVADDSRSDHADDEIDNSGVFHAKIPEDILRRLDQALQS